MKNNIIQIVTAVVFLGLLLLLTDPFMIFMPPMAAMLVLLCVVVLMCMWSGFILYEQFVDERELMHRMYAGRVAYLTALGSLTLALLYQALTAHHIDPWIALTLALMVISKLGARLYYDRFK
jgi:drug/metabolite transporter (DMT)-like permease